MRHGQTGLPRKRWCKGDMSAEVLLHTILGVCRWLGGLLRYPDAGVRCKRGVFGM
jgi:hypothetical protein